MSGELRYHPSADQLALANTFNASLASLLPVSRVHLSEEESDETWSRLDALGLFGMCLSEEHGGSGLGATEEALIVMELGRCLAAPSVLASIGATHAAVAPGGDAAAARSRTAGAYQRGDRVVIVEDRKASRVLLRADAATALYDRVFASKPLEERLWLDRLCESVPGPEPVAQFDAPGLLRLRLIDAAALSGIADAALAMGVGYAGVRKQFGRVIGSFQAVKHHCANMAIAARCARDQTGFAAVALDEGREDAALQVDCALLVAGTAALENAAKNIQIHGGIGFSDEADPHLLLKRAHLTVALAGSMEAANSRVADARINA